MFKNVGTKIKELAKIAMALEIVGFVAVGLLAWILLGAADFVVAGSIVFLVVCLAGIVVVWFHQILLYSWGELVETVVDIDVGMDMILNEMKGTVKAEKREETWRNFVQ